MSAEAEVLWRRLLERLEELAPELRFDDVDAEGKRLRLAGRHPEIGDLMIRVRDEEIVVEICGLADGLAHNHYDRYSPVCLDAPDDDLADRIVQATVDYLLALISDQVVIEIEWSEGRIRAVTTADRGYYLERLLPHRVRAGTERKTYLWSSPVQMDGELANPEPSR